MPAFPPSRGGTRRTYFAHESAAKQLVAPDQLVREYQNRQEGIMLGTVLAALWTVLSADDFAIPRWAVHELGQLLASTGSA